MHQMPLSRRVRISLRVNPEPEFKRLASQRKASTHCIVIVARRSGVTSCLLQSSVSGNASRSIFEICSERGHGPDGEEADVKLRRLERVATIIAFIDDDAAINDPRWWPCAFAVIASKLTQRDGSKNASCIRYRMLRLGPLRNSPQLGK